jgi:hypothetical protein
MKKKGVPVTMTFRSLKDDFDSLREDKNGIVDPTLMKIGQSEQGKDIHAIRIGKNPKMPVLIIGCHHAREWISVEIPFLFAKYLVDSYTVDPNIRRIVDACDIWIVPLANPDGHEHSVLVDRQWRKNFPDNASRPSVDMNRNYDTAQWFLPKGKGNFSDKQSDEIYRGPSPGFAKEVIAIQNLIKDRKFKGLYDFHSFGRHVMYPWFGRTEPPPNALLREMALHVEHAIDTKGAPDLIDYDEFEGVTLYVKEWGITPEEGRMPGNLKDFMLEQVQDAMVIGIELEPGSNDTRGFVLPESEIERTFNLHKSAMLTFLNCLGAMRSSPETKPLRLKKGSNDLIVFQPECQRVFEAY